MLDRLAQALRDTAAASGRLPRHTFARVRSAPEGGFRIESSDSDLLERAVPPLRALAGDSALQAVLLPEPELAGRVAWVAASVAEVRREPAHAAEQVTQALQGEVLEPLLHEDGWVLGRLPDGYIGWVRDWHLRLVGASEPPAFAQRAAARIATPLAVLREAPRDDADACAETVFGASVARRERRNGWSEVELAAGRTGWLPDAVLRSGTGSWPAEIPSLLATLRRFVGIPYLWGGKSPKGFDCSGLVQFGFALHGANLPRDSDEQAECGTAVDVPQAGDLLFFGKQRVTHVAVALGPDNYLHARGEVRRNALSEGIPGYDAELRALWCGTRRVTLPTAHR
jgi:gamma-D-glutamyl-L-lysine dipeptidyl-peptidase